MSTPERHIDTDAARARFEYAVETHEQVFGKFFLSQFLGLEFTYLPLEASDTDKTLCRVEFEVTDMLMNPRGILHGGIIATVLDASMGHLINLGSGPSVTVDMNVQYIRAVGTGRAVAEGRFVRRGRVNSFMESQLVGPDGKVAARATATWQTL